jgi:hypothetical protein
LLHGLKARKELRKKMEAKTVIRFLREALKSAQLKGSRGKLDMFCDRLIKAVSESKLSLVMEHLLSAVDADISRMSPQLIAEMTKISTSHDAQKVLHWLRQHPKIAVMLAATADEALVDEALADLSMEEIKTDGAVNTRRDFMIPLRVVCETPLAHGADNKAGNATLFRRMQVLTEDNAILTLPYYSGNALRGQMRDLLADHFLSAIGFPCDRSHPAVSLWFFYALYSGGALEEKSDAMKAIRKELGESGAIKSDGIRSFRDHLPALSLLGCALGNRILPGRAQFADLRPVCKEWGTGVISVSEVTTWEFLTRREDHEDHAEHHGMIANTEVLRAGTILSGGIDYDDGILPLEKSALGLGVELLKSHGFLGAESRRGFGRVKIYAEDRPDYKPYLDWLEKNKLEILDYMDTIQATNGEL